MARFNYERLSAQDNSFLLWETPNTHMHVASTQVYDLAPLATEEGGVDFDAIKRFIGSVLFRIPRYRQRLKWIPLENTPVWVDDPHFNLDYHVRHTALPRPGSDEQLKRLSARVMAQQLDRQRPLWEIWVVEGLEGDRFALISKIHHAMIDGASGVEISTILQSTTPSRVIPEAPLFIPRRVPSAGELFRDSTRRRLGLPFRAMRSFRQFRRETDDLREEVTVRTRAVLETFAQAASASETPLNGPLGPHRSIDWLAMPLDDIKALRKALESTVNDVVLTVITGALRDYLLRRQVRPDDLDFRIQAPVSVRREEERGRLGNRVSGWIVRLPLEEEDPLRQLERIRETTRHLKETKRALGVDVIMSLMEVMPTGLLSLGAQAASGAVNSIVTNVPGPQFPLYLLGAELREMFPQVPLLANLGLGIALISYNGKLCWGFNADPGLVPDLESIVELVARSIERLADAAEVKLLPPAAPRRGTVPKPAPRPRRPPRDPAAS